jgi:flavin-binding protein dodecin
VAEPFERRTESDGGVISRVLGSRGRSQAFKELESLFAGAASLRDVSAEQVQELCASYGVEIDGGMRAPARSFYKRFLEYCFVDCALSDEESADLAHLQILLRLDETDTAQLQDEVARSVYGEAIGDVLRDYKLDEEEKRFLSGLRAELQLAEEVAQTIYEEGARKAHARFLSTTTSGEGVVLASRTGRIELKGSSTQGLEDAIQRAIDRVADILPQLESAKLSDARVMVGDGGIKEWRVVLQGWLGNPAGQRPGHGQD